MRRKVGRGMERRDREGESKKARERGGGQAAPFIVSQAFLAVAR
jgi:hypothetical protein